MQFGHSRIISMIYIQYRGKYHVQKRKIDNKYQDQRRMVIKQIVLYNTFSQGNEKSSNIIIFKLQQKSTLIIQSSIFKNFLILHKIQWLLFHSPVQVQRYFAQPLIRQVCNPLLQFQKKQKQMEEDFFKKDIPTLQGSLLYESAWKRPSDKKAELVYIYEQYIKYRNLHLPFTFDLRFMITQHGITFLHNQNEISFQLVNHDQITWRNILRRYLNQIGFHEQFKPIKKIGKGNFASVYLAEKFQDGSKYAVKAFSKEAAYSEQNGKQCLQKEIQIMRHLNSPNNMKLCEVFQSDNSLYIIFQLLDGGQLFEKIKAKQKFKPNHIKAMIRGILEGLKEMHAKNIMHRDLKPQNILFRNNESYQCVIADYGLAEFADSEEYLFVRCGTPGYVAPQVINIKDMKAKYAPICDIFSLGLIFHILVFGKSLFKGKTYNEILNENRACNFDLDFIEYEQTDQLIMDLLKKMLKINPEERITAEQALSHPYFKEQQQTEVEELIKGEDLQEMADRISPLSGSPHIGPTKKEGLKRDSCLEFKMAKGNILTGKTETVGALGSSKISGFGAGLLKGFKPSKFVKPSEKENV